MKKTCMISQPCGIGDILFIQKIARHYADVGFHVVVPIFDTYAWMRYYIPPHPDIEYPLIATNGAELTGNFRFAETFLAMARASSDIANPENRIYANPLAYNNADAETGFVFLALSSSYYWRGDKMMPSKYNFLELDFSDWADYARLKRRTEVESELYYDVLGLTDDSCFTLVNGTSSNKSMALSVPGQTVLMREIEGFTLFDWSLVIEKAAQIVTIDTSLVLLTEILKQQKPLYMISRYDPPDFEPVKDILRLDWHLVPTIAELNVSPAATLSATPKMEDILSSLVDKKNDAAPVEVEGRSFWRRLIGNKS